MKRFIFNVVNIFALKPLFFEKNEIKWNQTGTRWGVFLNFKSSPIKWNKIWAWLYLEHFAQFCILLEIKANTYDFYGFLWFHHENRLVGNFQYYIRNKRGKIRKYRKFDRNRKVHLFGTAPLMGFGSFFCLKYNFSWKIIVLHAEKSSV